MNQLQALAEIDNIRAASVRLQGHPALEARARALVGNPDDIRQGRQAHGLLIRRPSFWGITVVRSSVRTPRMNAIMRRWVPTCRRELLDRTLIYNQRHLERALRAYETFYNTHRPHQGLANARPLRPLPEPITDSDRLTQLDSR
jgi:hypothetical protein